MSNSTVIVTNVGVMTHGVTIHLPAKQTVMVIGAAVLLLVVIWCLWPKRST